LDHLGLVAGRFDELGIGDVLDWVLQYTPETLIVTVSSAVKAMVLNGLGFVNQQLYLVPMFLLVGRGGDHVCRDREHRRVLDAALSHLGR
jgi:transposase